MIKLTGALLILFAGTMIGMFYSARLAARPNQIRQLVHALQRLETEIAYGYTPLPEAMIRTAAGLQPPVSDLLGLAGASAGEGNGQSFQQCWEEAIAVNWPQSAMKEPERLILRRLGTTLGISDREDQQQHLRLALLQLQAEEEAAREDQARYGKMGRNLGILGAALVVILMV
ncbi:stage III sporulation protein AB [Paenibacillus sp. IB182496]|uniref:Stage III sporulation protein AB n=1 Tax=Paenibacillus sabuli TaxID=2772509 RepID=A0A927BX84_9BACL|nr:stage III sporulation protein SpoIIIAB [Paenibacillus sabuli]MBD2847285.1 stage III sporulation protein AB [Paenibacillus sabuli]